MINETLPLTDFERKMAPQLSDNEIFLYAKLKIIQADIATVLKNQTTIYRAICTREEK